MTTPYAIGLVEEQIDALLADHDRHSRGVDFSRYRGDIIGFATEVLRVPLIYDKQREALDAFLAEKYVAVRGCHGAGKDWLLAVVALYSAYVAHQLVLVVSATERQLLGQVWREIGGLFSTTLPGKLYTSALEIGGRKRIIAMTSGSTSNLTGWHDPAGVCVLISESQAEQVEAAAFDAAIANTTSEGSKVLVVGNPVKPVGRFYEVCQKPHWTRVRISAFDHPNVIQRRTVIPGGPTAEWPDEVAREYGADSPYYIARVLGEFPADGGIDALIKAAWLEPAYERWEAQGGLRNAGGRLCIGLDVARSLDRDESVAAVAQGARLHRLVTWRVRDLVATADRALTVDAEARAEWMNAPIYPAEPYTMSFPPCEIHIDTPGIGSGVVDEMKRRNRAVAEYWGWKPSSDPERLLNVRSEVYWNLRRLLEQGLAQLPRDPMLREEMLAIDWSLDPKGRVQIASKDMLRATLGRSPDRLDATTIAFNASAPFPTRHSGTWGHSTFRF